MESGSNKVFINRFWQFYSRVILILYFILLFGTLSLGRGFSIFKLFFVSGVPVYITDFFVILALPAAISGLKELFRIKTASFLCLFLFLGLGFIYLIHGLWFEHSGFAFRGIPLSLYVLFLPLTFQVWNNLKLHYIFLFLIFCNIAGIIFGILSLSSHQILPVSLLESYRQFNLALYYGMAFAFLFAYGFEFIKGITKVLIWFLSSMNIYMIMLMSIRSAWVAMLILVVFFVILWKARLRELFIAFLFIGIFVFLLFFSMSHRERFVIEGKDDGIIAKHIVIEESETQKVKLENISKTTSHRLFQKDSLKSSVVNKSEKYNQILLFKRPVEVKSKNIQKVISTQPLDKKSTFQSSMALEKLEGTKAFVEKLFSGKTDRSKLSTVACNAYDNIAWRFKVWREILHEGFESPVWGNGFVRLPNLLSVVNVNTISGYKENSGITPPHNEFLTIFYKMGFVGLGLFLCLNGLVFLKGLRGVAFSLTNLHRAVLIGALGALVFWHVMAQSFDVIDSPPTNIFLWILLAIIVSVDKSHGKTKKN